MFSILRVLVLGGRLELPSLAALVPKTNVYTNSTIPAFVHNTVFSLPYQVFAVFIVLDKLDLSAIIYKE